MTYYRVRLQGSLRTLSALHIGSGEVLEKDDFASDTDERRSEASAVLLDAKGKPYLPASTLRGFLRAQLPWEQAEVLFGSGNQTETAAGLGRMGLVRIYDARCEDYPELPTMTRTSIDSVTQAAKQHSLHSQQVVPVNTCFQVQVEIDQCLTALRTDNPSADVGELDATLIQALLGALRHFQADSSAQLGKGKSIGQGRLAWQLDKLEAITLDRIKTWAQAKNKLKLDTCYQSVITQFKLTSKLTTDWQLIRFQLQAMSPLLINPTVEEADSKEGGIRKPVFFKRVGAQALAVIPASTLKGWCRAQCRRILLTLTQNTQEERVEQLLMQLFGGTRQVGILRFYDATVGYEADEIHEQTFNAIDRFTGGVKEGALYTVKALYPKANFGGQLAVLGDLKPWMQWLLLWVWRDAEEGDLVLGSAKSKGYGQLILRDFKQGAQRYFIEHQAELKQGADQLKQTLKSMSGTGAEE